MRSLIIIAVVVITYIGVSLIMPMKKDMQPGADTTQREATTADTLSVHAAQQAGGALTTKIDTVRKQSDGIHYAQKHRPSTARAISL